MTGCDPEADLTTCRNGAFGGALLIRPDYKELDMARRSTHRTARTRIRKAGAPASRSRRTQRTAAAGTRAAHSRRWSRRVTEQSDALDLDRGVFTLRSPKQIAASLKRSA